MFRLTAAAAGLMLGACAVTEPEVVRVDEASVEARLAAMEAIEGERGYVVSLGDVYFETDSAALNPTGHAKVAEIADYLSFRTEDAVIVEGHADARGDAAYNLELSVARAGTVARALADHGILTPRIIYTGAGESEPAATNATAAGRQENRRVDVILVEQG